MFKKVLSVVACLFVILLTSQAFASQITFAQTSAPKMLNSKTVFTTSGTFEASYIAPYTIISTPLGYAEFLEEGCTDSADPNGPGAVSALQSDLNAIRGANISISVDGIYGPETVQAVKIFQQYVKNKYGCSTMSIDGIAGTQTWTAIYAIQDGINPHTYIP